MLTLADSFFCRTSRITYAELLARQVRKQLA
jgi:hypothetical protein